jgi:hypothetical protein
MPTKKTDKKPKGLSQEQRSRRSQQIVFAFLAAIIILSWILSLVVKL